MEFETKIIPDFLSSKELEQIETMASAFPAHADIAPGGGHNAITRSFFPYRIEHQAIGDILLPKLHAIFGPISVDTAHLLDSRVPYGVHNDVASAGFDPLADDGRTAAWTFIIPLDDYDSHTIVFNEGDPIHKTVESWVRARGIQPHGQPVDLEFHSRYLSHVAVEDLDYLTVADVFAWKRGWLFAAARRRFHTSDNFPARGLANKRAIIMWTTVASSP